MLINLYNQLLIMSAVAGGLYLILKLLSPITGKYFTASWHYYSYSIVYTFFLIPYYRLLKWIDLDWVKEAGVSTKLHQVGRLVPSIINPAESNTAIFQEKGSGIVAIKPNINPDILFYLLFVGSLVFLTAIFIYHYKSNQRIFKRCSLTADKQILEVLSICKKEAGISKEIPVYISSYVGTPFLYSLFKSCIVLPDIEFTEEELRGVFLHELTHLKRHDAWLKCFLLFINIIHWFNPVAYFTRRDIDRFCELSCDERVVKSMNEFEKRRYCELMLNVLWNITDQNVKLFSAFSDKQKHLERRVNMILKNDGLKNKKRIQILAISMTLIFTLIGTAATYAANERLPLQGDESIVEIEVDGIAQNTSLDNSLGTDDTVSLAEELNIEVFLSGQPESGLNNPNPPVTLLEDVPFVLYDVEPFTTGNLSPNSYALFDRQTMAQGTRVQISASWTPSSSSFQVGVYSHTTGLVYYDTLSDGSGSAGFTINAAGEYSIYIANTSAVNVRFEVGYLVN